MRKLLTNDSNEADHRDEDAIAGVLIPLDNLAIQNCNEALWVYCIRCIGEFQKLDKSDVQDFAQSLSKPL